MAIAKVVSTEVAGAGTTPAVDTTGASLLVACVCGDTAPSISDSKGNTWNELLMETGDFGYEVSLFYAANPTVGTGHTFTVSGGSPAMGVVAFSGVATTSPFDQQSTGDQDNTSPASAGSVTPTEDNELLVAGCGGLGSAVSIGSSFNLDQDIDVVGGTNFSVAIAHKIQTTAGAENPDWAFSGTAIATVIATFKAAAGGGGRTTKNTRAFPLGTEIGMNWLQCNM